MFNACSDWFQPHNMVDVALVLLVILQAGMVWAFGRQKSSSSRALAAVQLRLDDLLNESERQIVYLKQFLESIPPRSATGEDGCTNELRRLLADLLATTFQISGMEQARAAHPELDPRMIGQLKDRALAIISRAQLYLDQDIRAAEDLVVMARQWIFEPKPEQYAEWEKRMCYLSQEVIRGFRTGRSAKPSQQSTNFATLETV